METGFKIGSGYSILNNSFHDFCNQKPIKFELNKVNFGPAMSDWLDYLLHPYTFDCIATCNTKLC